MKKLLAFLLLSAPAALAEFRFPKPEFSTGYSSPETHVPDPAAPWFECLSLGMLVLIMALSALAIFKWRSRRVLLVLMIISVIFFGFIRQGCVCAVGSIGNISAAAASADYPLSIFTVLVFLLPLLVALFLGRVFCSAACPFGALQDLLMIKSIKVNPVLDGVLRMVPAIFLGLAVVFATCDLGFIICEYDPFVGLFRLDFRATTIIVTLSVLVLCTFVARPYCRYLCPYGFLLKMASFFAKKSISITPEGSSCVNCQLCNLACPINAIELPKKKKHAESINSLAKKVQILLAMLPLFIAVGVGCGSALSEPVSSLSPEIQLLRKVQNEQTSDDAVVAFLSTGRSYESLVQSAQEKKSQIHIAMMLFGAWCGLIFASHLILSYKRRYNEHYEIDPNNCVNCLRCYDYCPVNQHKKSSTK